MLSLNRSSAARFLVGAIVGYTSTTGGLALAQAMKARIASAGDRQHADQPSDSIGPRSDHGPREGSGRRR